MPCEVPRLDAFACPALILSRGPNGARNDVHYVAIDEST